MCDLQSPDMKEEMIDEILDILEILRLSNLLSVDIVRAVAMLIAVGLKVRKGTPTHRRARSSTPYASAAMLTAQSTGSERRLHTSYNLQIVVAFGLDHAVLQVCCWHLRDDSARCVMITAMVSGDVQSGLESGVLQGENDQFPGANLLQVTWEHMTLLPQDCLSLLRDSLLNCLGQRWRWTYPVREMADQALYPQVSPHL